MATQNQPINNGTQNNGIKELGINKPTPFTGEQTKVNLFIQEYNVYLTVNRNIYSTEEAKITFILSYLTNKEALQWKEQYIDSITNATGAITFPPFATFLNMFKEAFKAADCTGNAMNKLSLIKQGN